MSGTRVYDRQPNFAGGMDAYRYAADLDVNQCQLLQNMQVLDNGRAITRPGADQVDSLPSTFTLGENGNQGLSFLDNSSGQFILMGKGSNLYKWNGSQWSAASGFTLSDSVSQFCSVQGMDKLLISDGVQNMQLWDGTRFTDLGNQVSTNAPKGVTIMSYIAGMFVVSGNAMVQNNVTYPSDTLFFSNYLDATSGHWSVSKSFRVGNGDGEAIVALAPIQSTASNYPVFQLGVLKENSVWVLSISPQGTTLQSWFNSASGVTFTTAPQGDQVGIGVGCVGRNAWCSFQNDLLFMSQDGVQSLQRMQAAAGQYQLTSPLSTPIQPYIDRINWSVASHIQAVKYRQLAIFFVPLDNSLVNNYALVWNGRIQKWFVWTGWNVSSAIVTRFTSGVQYNVSGKVGTTQDGIQLVMGDAITGNVNVWKDNTIIIDEDNTYLDNGSNIPWTLETRAFTFGDFDAQKKMRAALVRFNRGNSIVKLEAYCDLADDDYWSQNITPNGSILPVLLPFVLASDNPVESYRKLEGLLYCNEFYLKISSEKGWADIRNVVLTAFLKPLRDPTA